MISICLYARQYRLGKEKRPKCPYTHGQPVIKHDEACTVCKAPIEPSQRDHKNMLCRWCAEVAQAAEIVRLRGSTPDGYQLANSPKRAENPTKLKPATLKGGLDGSTPRRTGRRR